MERDYPENDQNDLIAFVHIPKTAGSTLNSILASQYAPDQIHEIMMRGMSWIAPQPRLVPKPLISFSKIQRLKFALRHPRRLRLIHGHFDLSIIRLLPASARCFTLLRDPVQRAISHYYHYRRMTADPVHALAMQSTLAQWVGSRGLVEMDNGQTRRLAGEMNLPFGRVNSGMLERAKSNLAAFAAVGLTERFEESLVLFRHAFGWVLHPFTARNVADNRPRRAELSAEALEAIAHCNRFDLELYRFGSDLFEDAASRIDMAGELARLRGAHDARRAARNEGAVTVDYAAVEG